MQIGNGLQAAGYSTWLYESDSLPGPAYLLQMGEAIEQSQAVVIIISQHSMASNQVTSEVVRAHEGNKPFIPLLHGVTQAEFQQGQPLWRQAIGASTSIAIDEGNIPALTERVARGLDAMEIRPGQAPAAAPTPAPSSHDQQAQTADDDLPTGPITYLFTDIEGSPVSGRNTLMR
jgi:hypothetical protein